MIYPRLKLARDLLSDDGVIFISIDDNELTNLKKICDEIFGESNFKSNSIIMNNRGGRDYGGIALQHDYVLIYTKAITCRLNQIKEKDKQFQYYDSIGGFNLMELRNRNVKFNDKNRPNLFYPFYVNPNNKDINGLMEVSLEPKDGFIEVYPAKSNGIQTVWRWGKEEKSRKNLNIEIFGKTNQNGGYMIVQKYRKTTKMQRSIWDEKEFVNERGTETVKELFNGKLYFDYPKSIFTIKRILELGTKENTIILDFFSGSATTAHALMELNAEDCGKRQFIMVQIQEDLDKTLKEASPDSKTIIQEAIHFLDKIDRPHNICELAKERIRRAGDKIKAEHATTAPNLDIGFRVLKLAESNMKDIYYSPNETSQDLLSALESNIKEDRTALDLLFACLIDWGVELSLPLKTETIEGVEVHTVNDGDTPDLIACFAQNIPEAVIRKIAARHPLRAVFRDSSFADSPSKINVTEIFKTFSPNTTIKVL